MGICHTNKSIQQLIQSKHILAKDLNPLHLHHKYHSYVWKYSDDDLCQKDILTNKDRSANIQHQQPFLQGEPCQWPIKPMNDQGFIILTIQKVNTPTPNLQIHSREKDSSIAGLTQPKNNNNNNQQQQLQQKKQQQLLNTFIKHELPLQMIQILYQIDKMDNFSSYYSNSSESLSFFPCGQISSSTNNQTSSLIGFKAHIQIIVGDLLEPIECLKLLAQCYAIERWLKQGQYNLLKRLFNNQFGEGVTQVMCHIQSNDVCRQTITTTTGCYRQQKYYQQQQQLHQQNQQQYQFQQLPKKQNIMMLSSPQKQQQEASPLVPLQSKCQQQPQQSPQNNVLIPSQKTIINQQQQQQTRLNKHLFEHFAQISSLLQEVQQSQQQQQQQKVYEFIINNNTDNNGDGDCNCDVNEQSNNQKVIHYSLYSFKHLLQSLNKVDLFRRIFKVDMMLSALRLVEIRINNNGKNVQKQQKSQQIKGNTCQNEKSQKILLVRQHVLVATSNTKQPTATKVLKLCQQSSQIQFYQQQQSTKPKKKSNKIINHHNQDQQPKPTQNQSLCLSSKHDQSQEAAIQQQQQIDPFACEITEINSIDNGYVVQEGLQPQGNQLTKQNEQNQPLSQSRSQKNTSNQQQNSNKKFAYDFIDESLFLPEQLSSELNKFQKKDKDSPKKPQPQPSFESCLYPVKFVSPPTNQHRNPINKQVVVQNATSSIPYITTPLILATYKSTCEFGSLQKEKTTLMFNFAPQYCYNYFVNDIQYENIYLEQIHQAYQAKDVDKNQLEKMFYKKKEGVSDSIETTNQEILQFLKASPANVRDNAERYNIQPMILEFLKIVGKFLLKSKLQKELQGQKEKPSTICLFCNHSNLIYSGSFTIVYLMFIHHLSFSQAYQSVHDSTAGQFRLPQLYRLQLLHLHKRVTQFASISRINNLNNKDVNLAVYTLGMYSGKGQQIFVPRMAGRYIGNIQSSNQLITLQGKGVRINQMIFALIPNNITSMIIKVINILREQIGRQNVNVSDADPHKSEKTFQSTTKLLKSMGLTIRLFYGKEWLQEQQKYLQKNPGLILKTLKKNKSKYISRLNPTQTQYQPYLTYFKYHFLESVLRWEYLNFPKKVFNLEKYYSKFDVILQCIRRITTVQVLEKGFRKPQELKEQPYRLGLCMSSGKMHQETLRCGFKLMQSAQNITKLYQCNGLLGQQNVQGLALNHLQNEDFNEEDILEQKQGFMKHLKHSQPVLNTTQTLIFKYPILRPIFLLPQVMAQSQTQGGLMIQKMKFSPQNYYFLIKRSYTSQVAGKNKEKIQIAGCNVILKKGNEWIGLEQDKQRYFEQIVKQYLWDISEEMIWIDQEEDGQAEKQQGDNNDIDLNINNNNNGYSLTDYANANENDDLDLSDISDIMAPSEIKGKPSCPGPSQLLPKKVNRIASEKPPQPPKKTNSNIKNNQKGNTKQQQESEQPSLFDDILIKDGNGKSKGGHARFNLDDDDLIVMMKGGGRG